MQPAKVLSQREIDQLATIATKLAGWVAKLNGDDGEPAPVKRARRKRTVKPPTPQEA